MRLFLNKKIFFLVAFFSLSCFALYHLYWNERINTVIEGRIYRSAQLSAGSLEKMIKEKGVRTIINLRGSSSKSEWYIKEREIAVKNGVRLYDIGFPPHDLPEYRNLVLLADALQTSERPILIHCRRGADRTGMASALAIAIEKDPPLSAIKEQFSWRNGVFPFRRSIGPYLFSKYEQWLNKTGKIHSREVLLYWIRNEYAESTGKSKVAAAALCLLPKRYPIN